MTVTPSRRTFLRAAAGTTVAAIPLGLQQVATAPAAISGSESMAEPLYAAPSAVGFVQAMFAMRDDMPVTWVLTGSSTTWGHGATVNAKRYVDRLHARLQVSHPMAAGTAPGVRTLAEAVAALGVPEPGIQLVNAGVRGTTAFNYLTATTRGQIASLAPRVISHMIGSNDFAAQKDLATYQTRVQESIVALDALLPGPCVHLLLHSFERGGHSSDPLSWAAYGRALQRIAVGSRGKVGFIDMSAAYAMSGVPVADPLGLVTSDLIHQSDRGHALASDVIHATVTAPVVSPASVVVPALVAAATDIVAFDTVSRADSVGLGGTESGQWYTAQASAWNVFGGRIHRASGPGGFLGFDVDLSDVSLSTDLIVPTAGSAGVGVRCDIAVGSRLTAYLSATGTLTLAKVVAGTLTTFGARDSGLVAGTACRLGIKAVGSALTVTLNGAQVMTHTLSAGDLALFAGFTQVGVRQSNGTTPDVASFKNLTARAA
jgi:GDSL-like Lipase/Acylhydrolase family